jgi:hypothetical protein
MNYPRSKLLGIKIPDRPEAEQARGINPVPYRAVFGESWVQRHAG